MNRWDRLRTSFWFLPSTLAVVATGLSFLLIQVDTWVGTKLVQQLGWLYTFGPEGARAILSAIAGSMITVAGLTFSITMLTLQLASSQFGPRLLRNFMRDRGNQVVLGTFISTFIYCLLVLRTVRGTDESSFVPHLSVAFGVILAIASIAVLIFFIHHTATSIRIETLLAQLASDARCAIDRLFPSEMGDEPPAHASGRIEQISLHDFGGNAQPISAPSSGYVQHIDGDLLMQLAIEHDLIVRIEAPPGSFVAAHDAVLTTFSDHCISDETLGKLRQVAVIGDDRTPTQDLEFSIRRIVEIAQRALSPGINDPTTALYCIDRLEEAFGYLAQRNPPSPARYDQTGRLRVVVEVVRFDELVCSAFSALARYAGSDADVVSRILAALFRLRAKAPPDQRQALSDVHEATFRFSQEALPYDADKAAVYKAYQHGSRSGEFLVNRRETDFGCGPTPR
ncbi:DUF2254 domain-containing protein [Microvirga sp. BT325]|uniref:DUF2254 domain-containing protein n=2 Tax=Microvirga splendida TaxID=2795727 RepID=A0ABS0Y441_9HYPH|nr:DUF2254 domain-containing protein [Microvirga splendida]MBJ6127076.1 DUF2254 domain-containing protein [Microvirga splendida]